MWTGSEDLFEEMWRGSEDLFEEAVASVLFHW